MRSSSDVETLGLYIQVPFCASKCSFCNFSSRVVPSGVFDAYCRALNDEIERLPDFYALLGIGRGLVDLPVDSVYVGGGTPSLLGDARLGAIVTLGQERFHFSGGVEFTSEITPGSAGTGFLDHLRALGVNRLSIGAQSFDDRELRAVGRLHSAADTVDLVCRARETGFSNVSLDLVAGLPCQTKASWLRTLREAVKLRPEHISVYMLEIDEKSRLGREILGGGTRYHAVAVPSDDFMAEAYEQARAFLTREGYVQYEISNFALPGYKSLHNLKYWRREPYVGLGAGAHSFDGRHRWANETAVEAYQERLAGGDSPIAEIRPLSTQDQLEEFFFLGLRQCRGVDLALAYRRWGWSETRLWEERIAQLAGNGWLERRGDWVRLPDRAVLVSNEILQEFLVAPTARGNW